MKNALLIVDAFTEKPFSGNPAAVCLLDSTPDDAWMQNVASETNLSETAFVTQKGDSYNLRWFTPRAEIDLCGHATLAAAHILFETSEVEDDDVIEFQTLSGTLEVSKIENGYLMNFPAEPAEEFKLPAGLLEALGVKATWEGRNRIDYIVEVENENIVKHIRPDFTHLLAFDIRGVIVTAKSDTDDCDFVSRFFCPLLGVNEDPVTGSAHCCLGPHWQRKLDKSELVGVQLSKRGGRVGVIVQDDRVFLIGKAVTIVSGSLTDIAK